MSVRKAVWINGVFRHSQKEAAERLSELLGKKIYDSYISERLKSNTGRFVMGGVEVSDRPPMKVWINGVERGLKEAAGTLGELFGRRVSVDWILSLLRHSERCVVKGVEIASYPTASWEGRKLGGSVAAENPPAERPAAKRRPLLNRRALDFGLPPPSWFA
jgi:hypothetical protein